MKNNYLRIIISSFMIISAISDISVIAENQKLKNQDGNSVSLEELWKTAREKLPAIEARLKDVEAIEQRIQGLPKVYIPSINAHLGYSSAVNQHKFTHGPLARLSAEWVLWDGGRVAASKKLMMLSSDSAKLQGAIFNIEVKRRIVSVYYDISRLEASIDDEKMKLRHFTSLKQLLMPRLRIGKIGQSDVEDISIRIEDTAGKITNMQMILEYKKRQLSLIAGADPEYSYRVPALASMKSVNPNIFTPDAPPLPVAVYLARRHVDLLEAKKEHRARELYWPIFGIELYGGYGPHRDAIDPLKPEIGAGAMFRLPILASGNRSAEIKALDIEIQAAKLNLAQLEIDMKAAADFFLKAIPTAENRMDSNERSAYRAEKNLTAAFNEFARGLKSTSDMISVLENLYELKSNYFDAKKEYLLLHAERFLLYPDEDFMQKLHNIKNINKE